MAERSWGGGLPGIPRRAAALVELPLLPRQHRWLHIETIYPGATSPQVQLGYRLRGRLDVEAWSHAIGIVVDRHEGLRASFRTGPDGPVQVIGAPRGLAVERIDLTDRPAAERAELARALLTQRQALSYDLAAGELVRSCLVRLADDDHVWTLSVHHIAADGTAMAVLAGELSTAYRALAAGTEPRLPEPAVRSGDYAVWRASTHRPEHDEDHRRFWRKQLAAAPVLDLRTDHTRPERKGAPAAAVRRGFGAGLVEHVESLASVAKCTRFIVLLAALQVVLCRWSGQRDFCIGLPVAGSERSRPDLANVVAPFNIVLTLRCDLTGDPTFLELLARTRGVLLESLMHQDMSLAQVVAELDLPPDPSRAQLCQALFLYDEPAPGNLSVPGVQIEDFPLPLTKMPYDLLVHTGQDDEGLWSTFHYDTALFTEATVAGRVDELERVLRTAARTPDTRLGGEWA
jgi:hypothetical protein